MAQLVAQATHGFRRDMAKGKRIKGRAVVAGAALIKALGFNNVRAFQRARQFGRIAVPLYPIPGQAHGVYAFLDDVEAFQRASEVQAIVKAPDGDTPPAAASD